MSAEWVKRGSDARDARWFSGPALLELGQAQQDIKWLLDRGYKTGPVMELVGGRRQFTARQRNALQRSTASQQQIDRRRSTLLPFSAAPSGCLHIDGFNQIITLEVALAGSPLFLGNDGVLRDLAGLRGTYRLIGQTDQAIDLIGQTAARLAFPALKFYLDEPVSNSGRLKERILIRAAAWPMPVEVELAHDPDRLLSAQTRIATSDSLLLDACPGWFNLSHLIIADCIPSAWVVDFNAAPV